jgi:hypothetical protein
MAKPHKPTEYPIGGKREYFRLQHSGFYNLKKMLKQLKGKLLELGYIITDKDHSEGVKSSGKEITVEWESFRESTGYLKTNIHMKLEIKREIDVIIDKKKMQKGDLNFKLKAFFNKNYQNTFKSTKVGKIQKHFYEKFLVNHQIDDLKDRLKEEGEEFIKIVKDNIM